MEKENIPLNRKKTESREEVRTKNSAVDLKPTAADRKRDEEADKVQINVLEK
jgi:hypothetical protein